MLKKQICHIGLISAMEEEIGVALDNIEQVEKYIFGDLTIYRGKFFINDKFIKLSITWSGWGKVSAARAATRLISLNDKDHINLIIFTGLAGGIDNNLSQGDVIIPNEVVMHDMDATPLFKKFEIPALKKLKLMPDLDWSLFTETTFRKNLDQNSHKFFKEIRRGIIATGDKFISDNTSKETLCKEIPGLTAVEMEGAAVAQVCIQEAIPWILIRVVSDAANDDASIDFSEFLNKYQQYSWFLIEAFLNNYKNFPN